MLIKMESSGGGSGWSKEDVLWTNPSPSAIFDYANCTMAHSIQDYDYLKVKCKNSSNVEFYCICPVENIVNDIAKGIVGSSGNDVAYRSLSRVNGSDTVIEINRAYPVNSSASSGVNNVFTPLEVVGLKL